MLIVHSSLTYYQIYKNDILKIMLWKHFFLLEHYCD